jgi:nucleoside-diphosphate-sugar epimerase
MRCHGTVRRRFREGSGVGGATSPPRHRVGATDETDWPVEIIGDGFLSRHLTRSFADRYPDVTAIAAGVTKTTSATLADFDREAALVYDVVRRARRSGRTVVFFSTASDSMYGTLDCPGLVEGPVYPVSAYGRHKLGLEEILARSGVEYLAFRLTHIVGEGQRAHQLIPSLGRQVLEGSVTVHRNAHRDLLDVEHLLLALDRVLATGVRQEVINVASGVLEPIERVVDGIEERFGVVADRVTVDVPVVSMPTNTARLRRLVPEWAGLGFGADYLPRLLDKYLDVLCARAGIPARTPQTLG